MVLAGLATNICCFFVARDLCQQGLRVFLVEDASAGIDVPAAGLFQEQTRAEAIQLGIRYYSVQQILKAIANPTE